MTDVYNRAWILENAPKILSQYAGGVTLRQLFYRLVAIGMINDMNHYKRVVKACTVARWNGILDMDAFVDRERSMFGNTDVDEKDVLDEIKDGKFQVKAWMNAYHLNKWSNQDNYVEVFIEKKALQNVFEGLCGNMDVGLGACKGYPSITFLYDAYNRFMNAKSLGKTLILLYFGDMDPSGSNIPISIGENLSRMGIDVEVRRVALNPDQIQEMNLPGVPPKTSDSRTATWDGTFCVELDSVEPHALGELVTDAIDGCFDESLYSELQSLEAEERVQYKDALKKYVNGLVK